MRIGSDGYPAAPPPPARPPYKVRSGDSLESIARAHKTSAEAIAHLNNLNVGNPKAAPIRPGQELQLPAPQPHADQSAGDPVVAALSNYERAANANRIIKAHGGEQDASDSGFDLDLDQAQSQLNQALKFASAANQKAGKPSNANEIDVLVHQYGGLEQFDDSGSAQSALTSAAGNLNNPQAAAVDKIFSSVSAPSAKGGNLQTREHQFANALAGQPPAVVQALRNDPRYQPLLNQFVTAAVGSTATTPAPGSGPETLAKWQVQGEKNLINLTELLSGQPLHSNGLPPSVAADIVNMPETQAAISNYISSNPNPESPSINPLTSQTQLTVSFRLLSSVTDSLGSTTPAAKQFSQEMAGQLIGELQTANVPPGEYSQYLDVKYTIGAQADNQASPSPALAIAVAKQLQASGDGNDAKNVIKDACSAVRNFATSDGDGTVPRALNDYAKKTRDLSWLIQNLSGGLTTSQKDNAIQNYIDNQSPKWRTDYQNDVKTLQGDGQSLASDITQLQSLPPQLKTSDVSKTLSKLVNNSATQQAISFAANSNPTAVFGTDGEEGSELLDAFEENVDGDKDFVKTLAQSYVQKSVTAQFQDLDPASPNYRAQATQILERFKNSPAPGLLGMSPEGVTYLENHLPPAPNPGETLAHYQGRVQAQLSELKEQTFTQGPSGVLFRGLGFGLAGLGVYNSFKEEFKDPSALGTLGALSSAVGLTQGATAFSGAVGLIDQQSTLAKYGFGVSTAGGLAENFLGAAGLVSSFATLAQGLKDGNPLDEASGGLGVAGGGLSVGTTLAEAAGVDLGFGGPEDPLGDVASGLLVLSSLVPLVSSLFSSPPGPPSRQDQLAFLNAGGFGGLNPAAQKDLLTHTSDGSSDGPGSSPWQLLVKYAQDKGYNFNDPAQRTTFVNWANQLADNKAGETPDGSKVNQLSALTQNLLAELDHTKGNVANFKPTAGSDSNFNQAAQSDGEDGQYGVAGIDSGNNLPSKTVIAHFGRRPTELHILAPQSAQQIDQLLNVIGAPSLPAA